MIHCTVCKQVKQSRLWLEILNITVLKIHFHLCGMINLITFCTILYEKRRKIWRLATTIKKVFLYMQYLAFLFHNLFPFPPCIALALMSFFLIDLIFCMICCAWLNTGLSWTVTMTLTNGWVSAEGNGNQGWNSCTCILMHKDGCIHF